MSTQKVTYNTAAPDSVALAVDLDDNVYVAWRGSDATNPSLTSSIYLLCSSNADTSTPTASSWLNLGQTTSTPDVVSTSCLAMAPQLLADMGGFVTVAGYYGPYTLWQTSEQLMGVPLLTTFQTATATSLLSLGGLTPGYGMSMLLVSNSSGGVSRLGKPYNTNFVLGVLLTRWRDRSALFSTSSTLETSVSAHAFLSAARLPRDLASNLWFAGNVTNQKIVATGTPLNTGSGGSGWSPPHQSKQLNHPHLKWVCPNGRVGVNYTPAPAVPIVSHPSKSAVYLVNQDTNNAPTMWAIDSTTGVFARSYTMLGPIQMAAATYSGNVHLFVAANNCYVQALIDNGSSISPDPGWATNPKSVGTSGGTIHSLSFNQEGSGATAIRWLYMLASVDAVNIGINKINADTGAVASGFNVGTVYAPNATNLASLLRIISDDIYVAGNISQVYRRSADGSAETMSSAVPNAVRRLMLWRNSNDLYVSPDGDYVYRLGSSLLTRTWVSGQSASPGTPKTSGAQLNFDRQELFLGVGNQLYRIAKETGLLLSNTPMATTDNIVTAPYEWKTYIYFGTDTGMIYAVNATTPTVSRANWPVNVSTPYPGQAASSVSHMVIDAVSNTIYVVTSGNTNRRIYAFKLE